MSASLVGSEMCIRDRFKRMTVRVRPATHVCVSARKSGSMRTRRRHTATSPSALKTDQDYSDAMTELRHR
eukprot:4080841-Alexandrium_andersonii.AAC.1